MGGDSGGLLSVVARLVNGGQLVVLLRGPQAANNSPASKRNVEGRQQREKQRKNERNKAGQGNERQDKTECMSDIGGAKLMEQK